MPDAHAPSAGRPDSGADARGPSGENPDTGADVVLYERRGPVAHVTLNRPRYRNAQNSAMTYALDTAFYRAAEDPGVKVVVLGGAGDHFSAGHDIGSPGRDAHLPFERRAGLWWDHCDRAGAESRFARESEVYLGMCRRWRELPKPVVAAVQGACVAGGLMLAWVCDLIVASEDAFFADPVVRMGIPGVEYFAHPWVMPPRVAKEFLYTGDRMTARRAHEVGMVNRVVARAELASATEELALRIARMPRMGLALAKRAVNHVEGLQGLHTGLDSVFGLHHLALAHNAETAADPLGGMDVASMKRAGTAGSAARPDATRRADG